METSWRCNRCGHRNPLSHYGSCEECDAPQGWEYDGPEDLDYPPTPAERLEMADRARRVK